MKPKVSIVMGSDSDLPAMEGAGKVLEELNIKYEKRVFSAHRSPEETASYARNAEKEGIKVIIAGAGKAAHLPGVIASYTDLPVIGVPMKTTDFKGVDSVLSILQMPSGIPVATMPVGKSGAKNAGVMAARILGLNDKRIREQIKKYRNKLKESVKKADAKINKH